MKKLYALLLFTFTLLQLNQVAHAKNENTYKNPTQGIEITKAKDWHFISAEQTQADLNNVQTQDEQFKKEMVKRARNFSVVIARHEQAVEGLLNPTLKIQVRPSQGMQEKNVLEILEMTLPVLQANFKDFTYVQKPHETKIAGLAAAHMHANYTLETVEGDTFPATTELWIVKRGTEIIIIGAAMPRDEKDTAQKEIHKMLKTLKIKH